jgi:hypothetical protein
MQITIADGAVKQILPGQGDSSARIKKSAYSAGVDDGTVSSLIVAERANRFDGLIPRADLQIVVTRPSNLAER